ncbi:hypothetical protein C3Y87_19355 [Carbonactinospora thermoautotrophica]|nr:hypothetical protein [Carbonactinospora thermoautotrophica]
MTRDQRLGTTVPTAPPGTVVGVLTVTTRPHAEPALHRPLTGPYELQSTPARVWYWPEPTGQTAEQARRLVRALLTRWHLHELAQEATTVVSELVGNVIRHAPGPMLLAVSRQDETEGGRTAVAVYDTSPMRPIPRTPGENGGFGLTVITALALSWGTTPIPTGGKKVWAVIGAGSPCAVPDLPLKP